MFTPTQAAPSKGDRINEARRRFGRPFAHEKDSTWEPHKIPVLTKWMMARRLGDE